MYDLREGIFEREDLIKQQEARGKVGKDTYCGVKCYSERPRSKRGYR